MMSRAEWKTLAKSQIKGNLGMLFVCTLIVYGTTALLQLIPVAGSIASVFSSSTLAVGTCLVYLNLAEGKGVDFKDQFAYINVFHKCFFLNLLVGLFIFLWSLLLIVPGIIKAHSYFMANYILAENPDMSVMEAIAESKRIMDGHKMELFMLSLSFIGWMLLNVITAGIAGVYTIPYMSATMVNFYNSIKCPVVEGDY